MKFIGTARVQLAGRRCLVRVDFNLKDGRPADSLRLMAVIPTLRFLLRQRARLIILSHRGRPSEKSKIKNQKSKLSLRQFARVLRGEIGVEVEFIGDLNLETVRRKIAVSTAQIILLENLRFHAGEEKNSSAFAKKLAALGDVYINDAFAVSHRRNASLCALPKLLPSYGGLLLEKEIETLRGAMSCRRKPLTLILGGAKISDKAGVIKSFKSKADCILTGGGVANTLLKARGEDIKQSLYEKNFKAGFLLKLNGLMLPVDWNMENGRIFDIGPETARLYAAIIKKSRAIIWSGPVGMFEKKQFAAGTYAIWQAILANKSAHTVVGGGETIASLSLLSTANRKLPTHIFLSTGGGAMLEYLSGKKFPGLAALEK